MSRGVLAFVRENFIIVLTGFGDALHLLSSFCKWVRAPPQVLYYQFNLILCR